ncbi:MAG: transcriptional regulator, IclR family [Subtercola sp.]|nr:transcriptional regulator, IclR family [Subtercola sp.]
MELEAARVGTTATESAGRVVDVLLRFLNGPDTLGVSQLAREMDVSKAVVHRALQTLASRQLLQFDVPSRQYKLGPAAAALGVRALRDSDLRSASAPHLSSLNEHTGETVTLTGLIPDGRVYLDQIVSSHEIAMSVEMGRRFPLHAGSSGKCILAFLDADALEVVLAQPLEQLTLRTLVDPDTLRQQLVTIRERGYAVSDGERQPDAGSVAAPVFSFDGTVIGAVSVCGPKFRVNEEFVREIAPQVVAAAAAISRSLGFVSRDAVAS